LLVLPRIRGSPDRESNKVYPNRLWVNILITNVLQLIILAPWRPFPGPDEIHTGHIQTAGRSAFDSGGDTNGGFDFRILQLKNVVPASWFEAFERATLRPSVLSSFRRLEVSVTGSPTEGPR
jgi:hypothetical protein